MLSGPYISKVEISNFRNFKNTNVDLSHKQVVIGENNIGKTNFLKAIQLILDPKLSDEDRNLVETDFFEGLDSPMENGEEIKISIYIRGFEHNKLLLSSLFDATVQDEPATLRLTYKYYAIQNEDGTYTYQYKIFQGYNENISYTNYHRRYLNLKVIPPIRDVEAEMRNSRRSPINKLIKEYDIKKEELEHIAQSLKATSDEVLDIEELLHLSKSINNKFSNIIGGQVDSKVSLDTIDLDPTRILNSLKIMIGQSKRATSDTSLGLTNILYISLILLSLEDKTVPFIIQKDKFNELLKEKNSEILYQCYKENKNKKYLLKDQIADDEYSNLYTFMEDNVASNKGFTILAIEEPESHLHPALQRIIYKDVMKNDTSILMTTHSPYVTSVAPLKSIVHLRSSNQGTMVKTTASLNLNDRDKKDLERYIDVKKGEIYFGKGVVLVEGDAEEYLVPTFAELLSCPLDRKGLICCNINSTNFKPYVQYLNALGIPYVVITDGDYYHKHSVSCEKVFGDFLDENHSHIGYDGLDRIKKLLVDLEEINENSVPTEFNSQKALFEERDFFIGNHTLEIDMMDISNDNDSLEVFTQLFEELTVGGDTHKKNFADALQGGDYAACLRKIESNISKIGKGRYSQALSVECNENNIPDYVKNAIETIYVKVDEL